nr:hypothetical protein JVH1_3509 [Rhodococcus sp. JVH1]
MGLRIAPELRRCRFAASDWDPTLTATEINLTGGAVVDCRGLQDGRTPIGTRFEEIFRVVGRSS